MLSEQGAANRSLLRTKWGIHGYRGEAWEAKSIVCDPKPPTFCEVFPFRRTKLQGATRGATEQRQPPTLRKGGGLKVPSGLMFLIASDHPA